MKKIVFVDRCFLRSIYRKKVNSELKLRLYKRRSRITSLFKLDRKVQIYNGNKFYTLSIAREMFGHRLVNFLLQNVLVLRYIRKKKLHVI